MARLTDAFSRSPPPGRAEPPPGTGRRRARARHARLVVAVGVGGALLMACGSGAAPGAAGHGAHAVGVHTETLNDPSRSTPANGPVPGHPGRTLLTTIWYPARGAPGGRPVPGAPPDRAGGPYPLIVFAHGFGSDVAAYGGLLGDWAAAGFVVAAPLFPLTDADAPGGPDLADYEQQPGDMSFVVTQILQESSLRTGLLGGLVDPDRVGAAGHSLGGVTTLGLVADTCCRDDRIRAAVIMAGDPIAFAGGTFDYGAAPPILLVQGNADQTVPYVSSVEVFNAARGPKGLLTIEGGGHGAPVDTAGRGFPSVLRATVDFFDRYLRGQSGALGRLTSDAQARRTTLTFAARPGSRMRVALPRAAVRRLRAVVAPSRGLTDGQNVTVSWEGYERGVSLNILECSTSPPTTPADCDLSTAALGVTDTTGAGSVPFRVHTGVVGGGSCDAAHPGCVIVVNQGGSSAPSDSAIEPISFAG